MSEKLTALLIEPESKVKDEYALIGNVAPFRGKFAYDYNLRVAPAQSDLKALILEHKPDFIIYDTSKISNTTTASFSIKHHDYAPQIPRIAFVTTDAHSKQKPYIFTALTNLKVERFFCVDLGMSELSGGFNDKTISMPWFVDESIFKDYKLHKEFPIGLIGHGFKIDKTDLRYPWRQEIVAALLGKIPFVTYPRPDKKTPHGLTGEKYARLLNRCQFGFCCGGARSTFVKKMVEIPASMSCLVTHHSQAVQEMGFIDQVNCLVVTPNDVVDKCLYYTNNQNELRNITRKGHHLVLSKHSMRARNQISDWFNLRSTNPIANDKITQLSISSPLTIGRNKPKIQVKSEFLKCITQGVSSLRRSNLSAAADSFEKLKSYISFSPEQHYYNTILHIMRRDLTLLRYEIKKVHLLLNNNTDDNDPSLLGLYLLGRSMLGQKKLALKHIGQVSCGNLFLKEVLSKEYEATLNECQFDQPSCFAYPSNTKDVHALMLSCQSRSDSFITYFKKTYKEISSTISAHAKFKSSK